MFLLHFSDLHVWRARFDWSDPHLKRWLGVANLILRRGRCFPEALGRAVVESVSREAAADLVIFSGDLTTTAHPAEFAAVRDLFLPLIRARGERFFLLPGNHDRYTPATVRREHFERAFPAGRFADERRPVRSITFDAGKNAGKLAVVGFDVSVPRLISSRGKFTEPLAESLEIELERHARAGRRVVLVGHYPYAAPEGIRMARGHALQGAGRLAELVARHKPVLYLHGHKHIRWAFRPRETPDTLCVNSGSAGLASRYPRKRAGYVLIELDSAMLPIRVQARDPSGEAQARLRGRGPGGEKSSWDADFITFALPIENQ